MRHEVHTSFPRPDKSTNGRANLTGAAARAAFRGLSHLAPGLASVVARNVFLTPFRQTPPKREAWWATEAKPFLLPFATSSSDGLMAWRWGYGGPKILLVHGWGGRGLQMGGFAAPLVEAGFEVIAFDAPGHGLSPGRQTSLPECADAIASVVRNLGGVHGLVAHSFGAAASTLALARAGQGDLPVERLVFLAPASDLDQVTAQFSRLTGFTEEVMERLVGDIERRFRFEWSALHPKVLAGQMRQPLLVMHDRNDRDVPWSEGAGLAAAWPGARLESTRGLGHHRLLRDAPVIHSARDFLLGTASIDSTEDLPDGAGPVGGAEGAPAEPPSTATVS